VPKQEPDTAGVDEPQPSQIDDEGVDADTVSPKPNQKPYQVHVDPLKTKRTLFIAEKTASDSGPRLFCLIAKLRFSRTNELEVFPSVP
jgi:hypothetical protein